MKWNGGYCKWCGAPRDYHLDSATRKPILSKFFLCGSWDEISTQDGFSPRYQSEACQNGEAGRIQL